MAQFIEKIATNFLHTAPHPNFLNCSITKFSYPLLLAHFLLPATPVPTIPHMAYNSRANHTAYGIQVSCQPYPVWFQTSHIWHGICYQQFPCQPYPIWHGNPKGWHGICSLHFPCQSRTIQNHIEYGWHNYCFSAIPMPIQSNSPQSTSTPDRREHQIRGENMGKTNLLFKRFPAPINCLKLRQGSIEYQHSQTISKRFLDPIQPQE